MKESITRYDDLLEEIRLRYKRKYNKNIDDEILYIIIRINELQLDMKKDLIEVKKEVRKKQSVVFTKGTDYFYFAAGAVINYALLTGCLLIITLLLYLLFRK